MTIIKERALVLRTCSADMTAYEGFVWPESGPVECPDWEPIAECGNGLHGALWGEGDGGLFDWDASAKWLVVEVEEYIDLGGKVKFPRGVVVFCGGRQGATDYIMANGARGAVIGANVFVGDRGTAIAGFRGTATAGFRGTAAAGFRGTAKAGDGGTATVGYCGTAKAGDEGTAMAGSYGTAMAGYCGTAKAGDYGIATAGDCGTARAGDYGTARAGLQGTARAGDYGIIQITHFDGHRNRIMTAYVGENGIKANTPYKLDPVGKFVEVAA